MKIQRINSIHSPLTDDLETLYINAFPSYERKPFETLFSHQETGFAEVFAMTEDERFIGMISTLKSSQLIFVEYFAISPEYRSLGYGSKVLSLLKEKYHDMNICLEIEVVQTDEGIIEERLRRLQFYEKNGFQQLNMIVNLFDVEFELLGTSSEITFEEYFTLYEQIHGDSFKDKLYLIQ
ncbi:GNAT family N-acetyltransferase [Ruoffia tabacinasalis]|uniref:GNAT family N-acetyltransferase n=1 Tax=Ruoffia tabacinasalis TaxID=87458 RepID=UPI003F95044E